MKGVAMFGNVVGKVALRSYPAGFGKDVVSTTCDGGPFPVLRSRRVAAEEGQARRSPAVTPVQAIPVQLEASAA